MKALAEQINELDGVQIYGRMVGVRGLMVEVAGPLHAMSVGARVIIETPGKTIPSEVIGFSGPYALLMPFAPLEGVRRDFPIPVGPGLVERSQCRGSLADEKPKDLLLQRLIPEREAAQMGKVERGLRPSCSSRGGRALGFGAGAHGRTNVNAPHGKSEVGGGRGQTDGAPSHTGYKCP